MTEEDKELLFKDLSARLPYGVKIMFSYNGFHWDWEQTLEEIRQCEDGEYSINDWRIHGIKPYLRPMSTMTEKEKEELFNLCDFCRSYCDTDDYSHYGIEIISQYCVNDRLIPENTVSFQAIDWLYAHHFDIRGLIEKGLALKAPEGMYE